MSPGAGDSLSGALDPLRVTFDSGRLVYPMRGSAQARGPESVTVYVLADHRVATAQNFGTSRVAFADWVDPAGLADGSALAPFVDRRLFLTKFQEGVTPEQVDDDFWFTFADTDETAHDTVVVYDDDYSLFYLIPVGLCLLVLTPLAGLIAFARRRRQGRGGSPGAAGPAS